MSHRILKKKYYSSQALKMAILCGVLFFLPLHSKCKESNDSLIYNVETRATFSGGENTPFWLVSNIQGLGAPELNNGYVRGEIFKLMSPAKRFDWGAGADISGAWNLPAPFAIRELYGEIHYRKIWLAVGSRTYTNGYNNPRLSSGDLLYSGNAMAIPQVRVGTEGFAPFWGTKGWFSVRGYVAYGKFSDSKWIKNWVSPESIRPSGVLYCSRGLWLRGGNFSKFPLTFDVGIEMATQFGGNIFKDGGMISMPKGIKDWFKALVPMSGGDSTPDDEQTNIQGNMNGEYSMSTNFSPAPGWNIRAYWEHYFEDHSQMTFEYGAWKDGLWGLELNFPENRFVSGLVYEYIGMKDQSGPILHNITPEIPEQVSGRDNYYNHYLYGAWQNWGMTIGTPLAISPIYNKNHVLNIYNTRFYAHHIGLEGNPCKDLNWRMLLTFSRNWGTYLYPLPDVYNNFSGLIEASYHPSFLKGWYLNAAIAWDKGKLLGNNFGGMLSIGKTGIIKW